MSGFRLYEADECGKDGYPAAWHEALKHEVREQAGHRCVRCGHPYRRGAGEWSPCDRRCTHGGPLRAVHPSHDIAEPPGDVLAWQAVKDVGAGWSVEARWRILTVHHLDGNKANCRWWNLAALCQRCHLQIQGKVRMERVWPWEHTEWFRPYVAGYYAHVYLGEDLSREDVDARLDELLALERVA